MAATKPRADSKNPVNSPYHQAYVSVISCCWDFATDIKSNKEKILLILIVFKFMSAKEVIIWKCNIISKY